MGMRVKTRLGPSAIAGIGVFAAEDIPAGTVTWAWEPLIDRAYSRDEAAAMTALQRGVLDTYAYWDDSLAGFVLCGDNGRFMNHAPAPNSGAGSHREPPGGFDVALRDIRAGEEITCDYRTFDAAHAARLPAGGA